MRPSFALSPTLAIRLSLVWTSTRARRSNSNSPGRFVSLPTRFFLRLHRAPSLRVYLNSRHHRHPSPLFASPLVPITPSLNIYHIVIVITIVIIIIHPTVSCIDALRFIRAYTLNAFIHSLLFWVRFDINIVITNLSLLLTLYPLSSARQHYGDLRFGLRRVQRLLFLLVGTIYVCSGKLLGGDLTRLERFSHS